MDDVVRPGVPTTIEFRLTTVGPAEAPPSASESVLVIATTRSAATLEPSAADCVTDAGPARFVFTARDPGEHRLRFTVYDPDYGRALQVLETTLPVPDPAPEPLGRS
ncbi:hypothetical protein DF19_23600 [Streptomyces olindensis]|nr:hypothetical protein DF19_23600 [Streptomyces olindensis]